MTMTQEEIEFTNAFNATKPTLALFSKCKSKDELHIVRDAFFLGMASLLCPREYGTLRESMITDPTSLTAIADSLNTARGLEVMITAARASDGWGALLAGLFAFTIRVNCDLDGIWSRLENGRLEWLRAINGAHPLKVVLKDVLRKDEEGTEKDEMDAKMVYIYALSVCIPALEEISNTWRKSVNMNDKMNPLADFDVNMWDCRKAEWASLHLGVQDAAERGGSSVNDAWEA